VSADFRDLIKWRDNMANTAAEMDQIMDELVVGEGVYAVKQAKLICKNDVPDIVGSGDYRNNWHSGEKAVRNGRSYKVDVFNNLSYAKHLEYGFRSHFVPGHWEGNTFVYQRDDPEGGMYVGPYKGFVRGRFVLRRAIKRTEITQEARLKRKLDRILHERLNRGL